jgi:hypothetical protein
VLTPSKSVAIVTGASQGIGRATAIRLARDFAAMVLTARQEDGLNKTAAARTRLMGRILGPKVAGNHTVDMRPYGRSGIPPSRDDHFPYSKLAMAKELVEVMVQFGFPTFTLIGHDRGGRVAYRMALDHPKNVERQLVPRWMNI